MDRAQVQEFQQINSKEKIMALNYRPLKTGINRTRFSKPGSNTPSPARKLISLSLPLRRHQIIFPTFSDCGGSNSVTHAMWRRNSLSLSSKLARLNSTPSSSPLLRGAPKFHRHGTVARSNFTSPESTSAADPVIWSQSGPDVRYPATAGGDVDLPAAAASASVVKAKEVGEFVRHYSRCYWELSKAKLRLSIFICFNSRMFSISLSLD